MKEFRIKSIPEGISADLITKGLELNKEGFLVWLRNKALIHDNEDIKSFEDLTPWTRTGGETFSTTFSFSTNNATYYLIAKAIVTLNPEKSLLDWTRRRDILLTNKIPVSKWYWTGEATIIETYYPKTHFDTTYFTDLIGIAYTLDKLGFTTLKFLDDLRCDGNGKPYYIDFGFDLGEPSDNFTTHSRDYLIKIYPSRQNEIEMFYKKMQI